MPILRISLDWIVYISYSNLDLCQWLKVLVLWIFCSLLGGLCPPRTLLNVSKTTKKLDKIAEIFVLSFVEIAIVVTLLALAILEQVSKYRNTLVGNFVIALGNNNRVAKVWLHIVLSIK